MQCDAPVSTAYGQKAVAKAKSYLGLPYVYGGGDWNGPTNGGFDCSGLMMAVVYDATGGKLRLSHSSRDMHTSADLETVATNPDGGQPKDPATLQSLQPGDLIIPNSGDGPWGHVGLYIGNGQVIHAPSAGKNVETVPLSHFTAEWVARRPVAKYTGGSSSAAPSSTPSGTATTPALSPKETN